MARPDLNTTVGGDTRPLEKDIRAALNRNYKVNLESRGFSQPLGKIRGQLGEFEKSLDASNARVLAFGASAGAIVAVQQALKATVTSAINVEKKLKDINVLLGASSKSLASFGNELFKIAGQTGQSFDAVAGAAAEFARQGLGLEKTLLRTRDALVLTRLSGLDVLSSVSSLTAAINSFSRAALNSTEIVNKLANVDASFAVSSADLANALSRVGSAAQDAGVSFDELLAIVTSAQQTTARGGAVIGNSLKTIFTRIQRPKVLDELEKLGVTVRNLEGETRPAIQILGELAKTFEGLSSTQKSQVGELVGGVFQINILKAALSDLNKEYSIYDNALQTSINSTDQALKRNEALNETLSALINKTFANLQKSGGQIGSDVFGPSIRFVLQNLNKALEGGDAESAGEKFGQAVFRGLGKFISGPGLVIAGSALIKIFVNLARFSADAFKTIQNLNIQSAEQRKLQAGITSILDDQPAILEKIRTGELKIEDAAELVLERYRTQQRILRQNLDIVKQIQARSNVKVKAGKAGKAAGYIPNYFSDSDKRAEEQTAMMLGATSSVKAKKGKGKIGGKSFLMNNQEVEIPNFGKNGDSAVIPTYAGGYIPNFSNIRETYEYPFRMMSRGKLRPVAPKDVVKNSREYELQLLKGGLASLGFTDAKDLNSVFGPNVQADFLAKKGGVPYLIDAKAGYNDAKLSQIEKKGATIAALRKTQPYKNYIQSLGINDADVRTAIIFGNAGVQQAKSLRKAGLMRAGGYVPNFFKGSSQIQSKTYNIRKTAKQIGQSNKGFKNIVTGGTVRGLKGKQGKFADPEDELSLSVKSLIMPITRGELNKYAKFQGISQGDALEKYAARYLTRSGFTGVRNFNQIKKDKTFPVDLRSSRKIFEVKSGESISGSNLISKAARYQVIKNKRLPAPVKADGTPQDASLGTLNLIALEGSRLSSSFKGKAKGFIPNFAEDKNQKALQEAIGRESSRRPLNSVRVSQVPAFRNKENPQGFVVTNTKDEPNGPSDLFARGYVPNFISGGKLLTASLIAPQVVAQLENFAGETNTAVQGIGSFVESSTTAAFALDTVSGLFGRRFSRVIKKAIPALSTIIGLGFAGGTLTEKFYGVSSIIGDLEKSIEGQQEGLNKLNESTSKYLTANEALNSALASGTADAKTLAKLYSRSADAIKDLPSSIKALVLAGSDTESIKEAFAKAQQEQQKSLGRTSLLKEITKEAKSFIPGTVKNILGGDGKFAESLGSSLIKDANVVVESGEFGFKVSEELTKALDSGNLNELANALGYTGSEADKFAKSLEKTPFEEVAAQIQAATQAEIQRNKEAKLIISLQKEQNALLKPYKDRVAGINAELKKSSVDLKAIAGNLTDLGGLEKKSKELNKILANLATGKIRTDKGRIEAVAKASQLTKELGTGRLNKDFVTRVAGRSFERLGGRLAASRRRFAPAFEGGAGLLGTGREAGRALLEQTLGIEDGKDTKEFVKLREGLAGLAPANEALKIATDNLTGAQQILFKEFKEGAITVQEAIAKIRQADLGRPVVGSPNALGFVPNFSAAASERAQAKMGGYNAGAITKVNIPGVGNVTANSAETVKQFPGMSQPAIMPPSFSKAGKNYKKAFSTKHGFNPYAAQGFVPNFALSEKRIQILLQRALSGVSGATKGQKKGTASEIENAIKILKSNGINVDDYEIQEVITGASETSYGRKELRAVKKTTPSATGVAKKPTPTPRSETGVAKKPTPAPRSSTEILNKSAASRQAVQEAVSTEILDNDPKVPKKSYPDPKVPNPLKTSTDIVEDSKKPVKESLGKILKRFGGKALKALKFGGTAGSLALTGYELNEFIKSDNKYEQVPDLALAGIGTAGSAYAATAFAGATGGTAAAAAIAPAAVAAVGGFLGDFISEKTGLKDFLERKYATTLFGAPSEIESAFLDDYITAKKEELTQAKLARQAVIDSLPPWFRPYLSFKKKKLSLDSKVFTEDGSLLKANLLGRYSKELSQKSKFSRSFNDTFLLSPEGVLDRNDVALFAANRYGSNLDFLTSVKVFDTAGADPSGDDFENYLKLSQAYGKAFGNLESSNSGLIEGKIGSGVQLSQVYGKAFRSLVGSSNSDLIERGRGSRVQLSSDLIGGGIGSRVQLSQAYAEALGRLESSNPELIGGEIGQKISRVKGIRSRVQRQLLSYTGRNLKKAFALLEQLETEFTPDFLELYKNGKISPAQRDAILERAQSIKVIAAQKRAEKFREEQELRRAELGTNAFGFIPNLAGGEALARKTERRLAGSAIRSFDPRIGTYYRSAGQPSNLNALIRRDHPEGLSQAIRNSYSAQHGTTPNFATDTSKAMEDLTVQIQELVSLLKENGQLDQAAAQTVQNTLDFTNNIGDINIEVDANQILANFQAAVAEMERKLMTVLKDNPIIGQSVRSQYA